MAPSTPLSTLLSQALVAFTIELDNEFERRFLDSGGGARITSFAIWSGVLRFVGDGITAGEFVDAVGLPKSQALSRLGGVERWRYVSVGPPSAAKREGYGSARGTKDDWVVRFTPAGEQAAAIWPGLPEEIEKRWHERFGAPADELARACRAVDDQIDVDLPEFLPIVSSTHGMGLELSAGERGAGDPTLLSLLAHVLMAYTLDFEERSPLSLALSANVFRVLGGTGVQVKELPSLTGVSKEAVAVSLTSLRKTDYVVVEGAPASKRTIRLTPAGDKLQAEQRRRQARLDEKWDAGLRVPLERILSHSDLSVGLKPYPEGWRASKPYAKHTERLLAEPRAALAHYPMVLHRGGWPDAS